VTNFIPALQTITFRDCRGHIGKVKYYYLYDTTVAANAGLTAAYTQVGVINAAILALTNALAVSITGLRSTPLAPNNYGANSDYANCETKARLAWVAQVIATGVGTSDVLARMDIPAPLVAIFLADKQTVNPANGLVATLNTALTTVDAHAGQACTRTGAVFTSGLVGGLLQRRKFQRKLTIWDKSANLDEEEE